MGNLSQDGVILTSRFLLRPLTVDDATERYLQWLHEPETRRYILSASTSQTLADLRAYIEERQRRADVLFLGIFLRHPEEHVGNIKYEPIDTATASAEMGILVGDPKWRSQGVAAEVIAATARWLRLNRGVKRIFLGVEAV